jgi:hypothetical protein
MRDDEADQRLEDHGGDREDAGLLHHHPERLALEQEGEIAQPDEFRHRLVQGRQIERIEGGIEHEQRDQQDQRQRQQECHGRFAPKQIVETGLLAWARSAGETTLLNDDIGHDMSLFVRRRAPKPAQRAASIGRVPQGGLGGSRPKA